MQKLIIFACFKNSRPPDPLQLTRPTWVSGKLGWAFQAEIFVFWCSTIAPSPHVLGSGGRSPNIGRLELCQTSSSWSHPAHAVLTWEKQSLQQRELWLGLESDDWWLHQTGWDNPLAITPTCLKPLFYTVAILLSREPK